MAHLPGDDRPDASRRRRRPAPKDRTGGSQPPWRSDWSRWLGPVAVVVVLGLAFSGLLRTGRTEELSFTEFLTAVEQDRVARVTIDPDGRVTGEFEATGDAAAEDRTGGSFTTTVPTALDTREITQTLREAEVEIDATAPAGGLGALLLNLAPFLLLIGFFWWMSRRARGQLSQIQGVGRSKAKLIDEERPDTTFDDVAGYDGVKAEIREAVDYLKDPSRYREVGARGPGGVLLIGPPGTGKTLLARAVAGEAEVPFLSVSGSAFVEMFVGVGASRVRDLFDKARKLSPCIIFIDELDAIGQRRRGSAAVMSNNEQEQTLNQLLAEMDGFDPAEGIVVMAATNRPETLDQALLRPGRFDRQITVDAPLLDDRVRILGVHTRGKPLADDVDLGRVARATPGFSGADLENLTNEAAIVAVRDDRTRITQDDFDRARDRILLGRREDSSILQPAERRRVAVHEAGHALAGALTDEADPVAKVTILPTRRALGSTESLPLNERRLFPTPYLEARMVVAMGGRVAELLVYDHASSGAAADLASATEIATRMVRDFGLSEKMGPVGYHQEAGPLGPDAMLGHRPYAEETQRLIDEEVARVLREAEQRTFDLLDRHRDELDRLVADLLEHETIDGERVYEIAGRPVPTSDDEPDETSDDA